jgi:hypothetical protein
VSFSIPRLLLWLTTGYCADEDDYTDRSSSDTPATEQSNRKDQNGGLNASTSSAPKTSAPEAVKTKKNDQPVVPAKSEYEKTREINIARNKVVLGILNSTIGSGDATEILVEELKKVGIELDEQELKSTLEK